MKVVGFFKSIANAQKYKRKQVVTPDEFLDAMERDFDRELDVNSTFFFRHHPVSVNLLHRILTGRIRVKGTDADPLLITAFMSDMTESCVGVSEEDWEKINKSDRISDGLAATLEAFSKSYPDAGNIIAQAVNAYFKEP